MKVQAKQGVWKRFCLLFVTLLFVASSAYARKEASIVICAETGKVLHAQSADAITHPASLAKMMTLYLTFKALREGRVNLKTRLPVSKHASKQSPTKLYLKPGTTISVKDAILALVTKSANDAAVVLAEGIGRKTEAYFATLMTKEAKRLGMKRTVFKNASGLPNKLQVTTARDMATLSRALYTDFPKEFKFFKETSFKYKGKVYGNHNKLLGSVKGVDGIKTGFINASGFNLAASMVRDNRRIIAVVLGGATGAARDKKMKRLLESTYKKGAPRKKNKKPGIYHTSIGDLINTLGPSEAHAATIEGYETIEGLLASLAKVEPRRKPPGKKKRKNPV